MTSEYEKLSLAQLKELAKKMGLKRTTQLRKNDLIQLLIQHSTGNSEENISNEPVQETLPIEGTQRQDGDGAKPRRGRPRKRQSDETAAQESGESAAQAETEDWQMTLPDEPGAENEPSAEQENSAPDGNPEPQEEAKQPDPLQEEAGFASGQPSEPSVQEQDQETKPESSESTEETQDEKEETKQQERQEEVHAAETGHMEGTFEHIHSEAGAHSEKQSSYHSYHTSRDFSEEKNSRQESKSEYGRTEGQQKEYRQGYRQDYYKRQENRYADKNPVPTDMAELDSGETKEGILEVMSDGYGFIRCDNYLPGENDVYVSPAQIRRFNLKTGDIIVGNTRIRSQNEKFSALLYVKSVNGFHPSEAQRRKRFEDLTPIFPNERIFMETPDCSIAMRMIDIFSPIGKGQRGMIVSQPKAGKTTILKQIAASVTKNYPEMNLIILLIDERPEEVTDIRESIEGKNVEVIYSTFDELPENHKRVSEMVIERAKRLVEHKKDVVILLDSITRLARAYNLTIQPSGRTLSGGLDPAALHMPKRFFGAARNMREGGSLTVLATALVDTGSRMDDVVFEEFKGTGNMEIVLDRSLSEKRIFPAIDLMKSSTRRDDLLLEPVYFESANVMRKWLSGQKSEDALEHIINIFQKTKTNTEFIKMLIKTKMY